MGLSTLLFDEIMKYFCLCITIFYALGIYCSTYIPYEFMLGFLLSAIAALLLTLLRRTPYQIAVTALAFALGAYSAAYVSKTENSPLYNFDSCYVTLTGRICELPMQSNSTDCYVYTVKTSSIHFDNTDCSVCDKVRITSPDPHLYGEVIRASGFLKQFDVRDSIGIFDYKLYYRSRAIAYKLYADTACTVTINESTPVSGLSDIVNRLKIRISDTINSKLHGNTAALLSAVLINDKKHFSTQLNENILKTGASRFLNSAHTYITFITTVTALVANVLRLSRRKYDILLLIVLVLTAGISSDAPVLVKSAMMIVCYKIYIMKYGFLYVPDILPITVLIILIGNPLYAYDAGFVMSVSSTVILFIFGEPACRLLNFVKYRRLRDALVLWLLLNVGMLPLSAYYFNGFSPYTIIYSLFLSPIIFVLRIASCILLLPQNPICNAIISFLAYLIISLINFVASLPFSYVKLATPSLIGLALYGCVLILIKYILDKETAKTAFVSFLTAAIVCVGFIVYNALSTINSVDVGIVNVGQGDAAVLSVPFRETVIIDGGGGADYSDYNVGENVFIPYLEHYGYSDIDLAIVSHYHKDHTEGIIAALQTVKVKQIVMPDCMADSPIRGSIEYWAKRNGTKITYSQLNSPICFPSGLTITFLSPNDAALSQDSANDTSIVADVTYGEFNMLFTGDITENIEKQLVESNRLSHYDVVKTAHHGSSGSTCDEFLSATEPDYAVIGVGENNPHNHPHPDTLNRLYAHNVQVLRTDKLGDIHFIADKNGLKKITYFKELD